MSVYEEEKVMCDCCVSHNETVTSNRVLTRIVYDAKDIEKSTRSSRQTKPVRYPTCVAHQIPKKPLNRYPKPENCHGRANRRSSKNRGASLYMNKLDQLSEMRYLCAVPMLCSAVDAGAKRRSRRSAEWWLSSC